METFCKIYSDMYSFFAFHSKNVRLKLNLNSNEANEEDIEVEVEIKPVPSRQQALESLDILRYYY